MLRTLLLTLLALGFADTAPAQPAGDDARVTLQAGLLQPLAFNGGNVAVSYKRGRLVADYSHGFALDYNARGEFALTETQRAQGLDIDVPWTTGFGVGYRITPRLDVRAEFKAHRYDVAPPQAEAFSYTTFTVGPGVYYEVPVWRRLSLEASVRYWPNVATTLDGGERSFLSSTGEADVHEAYDLPVIGNVSVGWSL